MITHTIRTLRNKMKYFVINGSTIDGILKNFKIYHLIITEETIGLAKPVALDRKKYILGNWNSTCESDRFDQSEKNSDWS
jgi:hypothetical protein